jgi:hypothetical protein
MSRCIRAVHVDILMLTADAQDKRLQVGLLPGRLAMDRRSRDVEEVSGVGLD